MATSRIASTPRPGSTRSSRSSSNGPSGAHRAPGAPNRHGSPGWCRPHARTTGPAGGHRSRRAPSRRRPGGQASDHGGERFSGQQGFDEAQPGLDQPGRDDRLDRFEQFARRLIQPGGEPGAETADQRCSGGGGERADPVEAHQAQAAGHLRRQSQRLDRQVVQDGGIRRHHADRLAGEPGHRMGGGGRVGDGGTGRQAAMWQQAAPRRLALSGGALTGWTLICRTGAGQTLHHVAQ